jgi:hypothetical protein
MVRHKLRNEEIVFCPIAVDSGGVGRRMTRAQNRIKCIIFISGMSVFESFLKE